MITILAIGKKHEDWIAPGLARYEKRLKQPWCVAWQLLPHSSHSDAQARQEESERLLARIKPGDYVVLCDETGTLLDSPALSTLCQERFLHSQPLVIVIGGAYGVDEKLVARANYTLSLSTRVFPHQLVRLILAEQLYRCQAIASGSAYHHE
jgi:23S rRNA (pseudouridine1915-N3)-methyltransferase